MSMKFSQLQCKEVICAGDGRRLGFVSDVEINAADGCVAALIVPGPCRFLGVAGRNEEFVIPWSSICRIGPDIVLVDIDPNTCRRPREKEGFLF